MEETIGARLKMVREERGYTQRHLEQATGIPCKTIGNYEQGYTPNPPADSLLKIAEVLDCSPGYLVDGGKSMNNYTDTIKEELKRISEFEQLDEIRGMSLNNVALAHLALTDGLIESIRKSWNRDIFNKTNSRCTKSYVVEVILRYCQHRQLFREKFGLRAY